MAIKTLYFRRDDGSKLNRYFILDAYSEIPTDTLLVGDIAYAIDTDTFYIADTTSSWSEVGGSGAVLKLDQTTPQTVENGTPTFAKGIIIKADEWVYLDG